MTTPHPSLDGSGSVTTQHPPSSRSRSRTNFIITWMQSQLDRTSIIRIRRTPIPYHSGNATAQHPASSRSWTTFPTTWPGSLVRGSIPRIMTPPPPATWSGSLIRGSAPRITTPPPPPATWPGSLVRGSAPRITTPLSPPATLPESLVRGSTPRIMTSPPTTEPRSLIRESTPRVTPPPSPPPMTPHSPPPMTPPPPPRGGNPTTRDDEANDQTSTTTPTSLRNFPSPPHSPPPRDDNPITRDDEANNQTSTTTPTSLCSCPSRSWSWITLNVTKLRNQLVRRRTPSIMRSPLPSLGGAQPSVGSRSRATFFVTWPRSAHLYWWWEWFVLICTFYTLVVGPFEFAFIHRTRGFLYVVDIIVNVAFVMDVFLTFFVDKNTYKLVVEPTHIVWIYAKSSLVPNIISIIPSQLACLILLYYQESYCSAFCLVRLVRLCRICVMFARLEKDQKRNYFIIRYAKLLYVALLSIHIGGCGFFFVASRYYTGPTATWLGLVPGATHMNIASLYVRSFYWSLTTFSTVGYGDVHPQNTGEIVYSTVWMMLYMGLGAYVLGNLTELILLRTNQTMKYRDEVQFVTSFAHRNGLPSRLEQQMLDHLHIKYRTKMESLQYQKIIDSLPRAVGSSISLHLFRSIVEGVYLFRGVSNGLLFRLATEINVEYFPAGADVMLKIEKSTDLYIFVTGAAELITQNPDGNEHVSLFVNHHHPIHLAVFNQHVEAARWLIKRGADPDIEDKIGNSARFYARRSGGEIMRALCFS